VAGPGSRPIERHPVAVTPSTATTRADPGHPIPQRPAAGHQLLSGQFLGARGRMRDHVRDPNPAILQVRQILCPVAITGLNESVGDAGPVQRRIEPIPGRAKCACTAAVSNPG